MPAVGHEKRTSLFFCVRQAVHIRDVRFSCPRGVPERRRRDGEAGAGVREKRRSRRKKRAEHVRLEERRAAAAVGYTQRDGSGMPWRRCSLCDLNDWGAGWRSSSQARGFVDPSDRQGSPGQSRSVSWDRIPRSCVRSHHSGRVARHTGKSAGWSPGYPCPLPSARRRQ